MKYGQIFLLFFFLTGCADKTTFDPSEERARTQAVQYSGPSSTHYNFAQYVYDKKTNKPTVIIKGRTAQFFKGKGTAELKTVTIFYNRFYDTPPANNETRLQLTQITSDEATIYETKKIYELRGNVVVISKNGIRLETQKIFFNEEKNRLYTKKNEPVSIYNTDGTITRGFYLRSDAGLSQIMLDRQLTATPNERREEAGTGRQQTGQPPAAPSIPESGTVPDAEGTP